MLRVYKGGVSGFCGVVPGSGGGFATTILRGGDDLEVRVFEFCIEFLPAWQIEFASSPTGPCDDERLLAFEVR